MRACVCGYVCISTHTFHTRKDTLTAGSRRRGVGAKCPALPLSLSPSDQLMRSPLTKTVALMWTVHDTSPSHFLSFSLSLSVSPVSHSPFPAIPAPFAPSLPSTAPPATFVPFKVANDCRSFSLLSTLEFSPPLALSLCPFLSSQPPMNAFFSFFHRSCCSLSTPWSRPSHKLWSAIKNCTFIVCEKERRKKSKERR